MDIEKEVYHLRKQLNLYDQVLAAISPAQISYSELTSVIGPILTLNKGSLESMLLLVGGKHYRDMIILSRPFLEAIINIGFICAEGEHAVVNSKKYAYQKGYRDLFHGIEVNGFKIETALINHVEEIEKAAPEHMKEALADFTTKNGREINSWTPETTKAKLEKIGKVYGDYVNGLLTFAFYSIYRDVSEMIHNSYYGARIYLGMQQKDIHSFKSPEDAAKYFGEHQEKLATLLLQQVNISVNALLNILSQQFPISSTKEIFDKSNDELVIYAKTFKAHNDDSRLDKQ